MVIRSQPQSGPVFDHECLNLFVFQERQELEVLTSWSGPDFGEHPIDRVTMIGGPNERSDRVRSGNLTIEVWPLIARRYSRIDNARPQRR
jgi:hypothetical protein